MHGASRTRLSPDWNNARTFPGPRVKSHLSPHSHLVDWEYRVLTTRARVDMRWRGVFCAPRMVRGRRRGARVGGSACPGGGDLWRGCRGPARSRRAPRSSYASPSHTRGPSGPRCAHHAQSPVSPVISCVAPLSLLVVEAQCPWLLGSCLDLASSSRGRMCGSLCLPLVCRRTSPPDMQCNE